MPEISYFAAPSVKHLLGPKTYGVQMIIKAVLEHYALSWPQVDQPTRKREIVQARQIIMYLLRKKTNMTLRSVGLVFKAKFHHTTTIHSINHVQDLLVSDPQFEKDVQDILNKL